VSIITKVILVEVVFALVYVICDILPQLDNSLGSQNCSIYNYVMLWSYATALFCSYFALWLRTYAAFYRNKLVKQFLKKWVSYVNSLALLLLIVVVISILVLEWTPPLFVLTDCSCIKLDASDDTSAFTLFRSIYYVVCVLSLQGTFLFSFIFPLYTYRRNMHFRGFVDVKSIMPVVNRAAVVGVTLIVSDLLLVGIVAIFQTPNERFNHTVTGLNLLINAVATVVSFTNWRETLFPYFHKVNNA